MFFSAPNFKSFRNPGRLNAVLGLVAVGMMAMATSASAVSMNSSPLGGPGPAIAGGGGNLTSFSGNYGAMNNNQWNTTMNPGRESPVADFGNCNALILRCASPKCPGGGCTDMSIARTIVRGCVQSNASCQQYGDDLIEYISAQLVASATNRAQESKAQAQAVAAAQSAQADASTQQLAAMQQQMSQMQAQMAQQQQQSEQQIAAALAERNAALAAAAAPQQQASAPQPAVSTVPSANAAMESAIARGVSAETIARNQASGRILSQLENVTAAMANVKKSMQDAFEYAGCDTRGENCTGPNRVTAFKQKASAFFDPFETVQDEVYDALIQAQALGVDISDVYMMLSSSCNVWGQYLCESGQVLRYSSVLCDQGYRESTDPRNPTKCTYERSMLGKIVPMADGGCQLLRTLPSGEAVYQSWLDVPTNDGGRTVSVACASDALENSGFFQNRRKKIDDVGIDDLAVVLGQDVHVPTGAAPSNLDRVCFTTSTQLQEILMSNRYGSAEAQSELINPSSVSTYRDELAVCKQNCRGEANYWQQGYSTQRECEDACDSAYIGVDLNTRIDFQRAAEQTNAMRDTNITTCRTNCYTKHDYSTGDGDEEELERCLERCDFGF